MLLGRLGGRPGAIACPGPSTEADAEAACGRSSGFPPAEGPHSQQGALCEHPGGAADVHAPPGMYGHCSVANWRAALLRCCEAVGKLAWQLNCLAV